MSSSPSTAPALHPVPAAPLRTATVQTADRKTYALSIWAQSDVTDCVGHAYGTPVIDYLTTHPCHGVSRTLATTVVNGRGVGFSAVSINFVGTTAEQGYSAAGKFRALVVQDGTGSLNDLLREGYRLPAGPTAVPYPDAFSALSQDAGVMIYDAWYLTGPTADNDPALVEMEHDIFLQY